MIAQIHINKHNSGKVNTITNAELKQMTQMILESATENKTIKSALLLAAVAIIKKDISEEISHKVLLVAMQNFWE